LTIKGQPNEDAVLCTNDKTYTLRSVALSNSVLVVTPPPVLDSPLSIAGEREAVVIRDELHEILEVSPTVPKLHKLIGLLRGREYDESDQSDSPSKVRGVGDISWHA
jgi:sister chromatid cohesion protein DCC1